MAWQTPKTNWQAADVVSKDDFNRIEGNIQHLQDTKETPAGAQAKANTAEANAKNYVGNLVGSLSSLATTAKNNVVAAINEVYNWLNSIASTLTNHLTDKANPHSVTYTQVGAAPSSHVGATGTAHGVATTSVNGFMSAEDKGKLAGIEPGANKTIIANNLIETIPGKALDATQGKALDTRLTTVAGEIDELYPTRYLFGMVPSDTVLASHTETVSTNYSAWKTYPKCFVCKNGGKYRVTFDYTAPATNYRAEFYIASGSGIKLTETVSKEPGTSGSVTLDTTIDISAGDSIKIMWRSTGGEGPALMYGASIKGTLVATATNLTLTGVTVADNG